MGLRDSARRRLPRAWSGRLPFNAVSPDRQWSTASTGKVRAARCSCDTARERVDEEARHTLTYREQRTRRDLSSVLQNILQRLPRLSVPAQRRATLGLDFQAAVTPLVLRKVHEVQRGMRLVGSQHDVRVQMSRVVIPVIQCKIPFRVKDRGFVEVCIETCPNERAEALEKVGQVGWRRFGLMRLHAFKTERKTRSENSAVCRYGMRWKMKKALVILGRRAGRVESREGGDCKVQVAGA